MKLVALAALIAVCGAAKLDRSYLPPASAATAGGNSDSLQTPLTRSSEQGDTGSLPSGSYTNNFQGVVVDAAGAGTRASPDADQSGLGGPRDTYGSQNSKVGDAAFRGSIAGFRNTQFGSGFNAVNAEQNLGFESKSERPQAFKDRNSNIISYANDVSVDNYSYGFESDNGIAIGENGVANNGIQAQGGYSYKGDDGQIYKVTYVADEGGYRPQGDHLPTPPPIPKEILESLEQNAKDEAAGLIDDGSYDAQKYNAEGDYTHHNGGNIQYNAAQLSQFAKRPESDATASNTFINKNSQAFSKPGQFGNTGSQNSQSNFNDQTNQFGSKFGNNQNGQTGSQFQPSSQTVSGHQASSSTDQPSFGISGSGFNNQFTQFDTQGAYGGQNSQFGSQNKSETSFPQIAEPTSQSTQQVEKLQLQGVSSSSQFASQQYSGSTASISGQANKSPSFGGSPNTASNINSVFNLQQNQLTNQQIKPQGTFGATEYLPPFKSNNKPSNDKQINGVTSQDSSNTPNIISLAGQNQGSQQSSSVPSFTSVVSGNVQSQSNQVLAGFFKQPSQNQYSSNNEQIEPNSSPISTQYGESSSTGIVAAAKPTSIPSIELTTPLEPNESLTSMQVSQINSENSQNVVFPLPAYQPQFEGSLQNSISVAQQPISQSSSPLLADSRPQGTSQFSASSPVPATFSTTLRPNTHEGNFHYSQNSVSSIPSFAQGSDNSYYYNQPSKPFGIPIAHPQAPRFPITSFNQPNVVSTQNNKVSQQQSFNPINSPSSLSATPTSSSQFTQTQGSFSTNQYNGITQASISSFPSVSPTSASQYNASPADRFESKPSVPSFPSKPGIGFGQNPSTSFTQNQIQLGQSSSSNSNVPSVSQSVSSKPMVSLGQHSFTQTSTQFQQNNIDKPQNDGTNHERGTSTLTQQYDGTLYEYNKPPEVLPASEQSDSSSSQTVQTDSSSKPQESPKPQTGPQSAQISQNTFSLQSQQSTINKVNNPQFSSQPLKPFSGSQQVQNQFSQISQTTVTQQNAEEGTAHPIINQPNESVFSNPTQFSQNQQTSQFAVQPAKPVGQVSSPSQYGQNLQNIQANQQSNKPFSGAQTFTQFGQNTQSDFESFRQQNSRPQAFAKPNRPFGSVSSISQFGQAAQQQNSLSSQQPSSNLGSYQSGVSPSFQGYPSSKPQIGNQLALPQFTQQTFGSSQINPQTQADTTPSKPYNTASAIHGSPDSLKPHFEQNGQLSQGSFQPGSSFSQQSFQASQFGSKPQFSAQSQFGQNLNAANPFGSATSQAQVGQNSAQASSSAVSQPSSIQPYRPFGNSNFQSQNKPQFDQALQSSIVSTTSAPQTEAQSFGTQGSQNQPSHTVPCCKSINKDSAIAPLNVGKPSQAFAQTQSQFAGFQGSQSYNAQSLAGKGEEFGGPRQPPSFDAQSGYHY